MEDFFHRQIISDPISPELKVLEKRIFAEFYGTQKKGLAMMWRVCENANIRFLH